MKSNYRILWYVMLFIILLILSAFACSRCETKATEYNSYHYQLRTVNIIDSFKLDQGLGTFTIIEYRGHEYILWRNSYSSGMCHSECCTCKYNDIQ